jgi:nucleotide-binding universal stress UspA family protein
VRLLVAYDGSEGGRDALELGRVLCTETGASALVVDVVYAGPLPMEFALLPEEEAAAAGPAFAIARETLAGIEVETRAYGGGSPAAILTSVAEQEQVDGIVIGSPHRSGLDRFLSGSVATGVLNGAHTDVYVAPAGYADGSHDGIDTIAVGYLGTPESKEALRRALRLVGARGRIEILTVVEPPIPLSPRGENLTKPLDPGQVAAEGVGMVPAGTAVEARLLSGAAAPELEKACAEGIDLLVLGSRGYGPVRRTLLGSASGHALRHAPCPLLITRRP